MHDIIIDNQNSSATIKVKAKRNARGKGRAWSTYLFDWLVKGVLIALLVNINFVLFASSGNFHFFSSDITVSQEAIYIMAGTFAISLILLFLISFSSFIQNVLTSFVVALFVLAMMNQFALFDKGSILYFFTSQYLDAEMAKNLMTNSDMVIAVASGIIFFIFLAMSSNQNIAYFTGVLLVIFAGILADEYLQRDNKQEFLVTYDNHLQNPQENGKKFIYLMLPNAASYSYLEDMKEINTNTDTIQKTMDIMLAFYAKNNFMYYPNAYVSKQDPFMNAVKSLNNISKKNPEELILKNVAMEGYWRFKNINDEYVYMKENALFDTFRKAKYRISAYKSRGLDLCDKDNEINVDKCVEKVNAPVSFENINVPVWEKTLILASQWIHSTGLFPNRSALHTVLKAATNSDELPLVGISYSGLYVIDSIKMLDFAAEDIIKDKGNRAYFVMMDMPSDMFVYDEYCRIKSPGKWLAMESLPWILNKNIYSKRNAYMEQTECLYGKLEDFIGKLEKSGILDNSVLVIQGLSGADDIKNVKEMNFVPDFKSKKMVAMAIRDPLKNNFMLDERVCDVADILKQYLYKRGRCSEMSSLDIHEGGKNEIKASIEKVKITDEKLNKAKVVFDSWYNDWKRISKLKGFGAGAKVMLPQLPVSDEAISIQDETEQDSNGKDININDVEEEVNLDTPKVMNVPVEMEPEDEVKAFEAAIQAEEEKSEVKGLPQEESESIPAAANDNGELAEAKAE